MGMGFPALLGRMVILVAGIAVGNGDLPLTRLGYQSVRNGRRVFRRFLTLFLVGRLHHEFAERHGFYRGVTPNWDEGVCLGKDFLKNIIYRGQSVQKFLDQVRFGDGRARSPSLLRRIGSWSSG